MQSSSGHGSLERSNMPRSSTHLEQRIEALKAAYAAGDHADAFAMAEPLTRLWVPRSARAKAHLVAGLALDRLGRSNEALTHLERAARLGEVPLAAVAVRAVEYFTRARTSLQQEDKHRARLSALLRWSEVLDPQSPVVAVGLAQNAVALRAWRDAKEYTSRALELGPASSLAPMLHQWRSMARLHLAEYAEALEDGLKAVELDPDSSARLLVAELRLYMGQFAQAAQAYEAADQPTFVALFEKWEEVARYAPEFRTTAVSLLRDSRELEALFQSMRTIHEVALVYPEARARWNVEEGSRNKRWQELSDKMREQTQQHSQDSRNAQPSGPAGMLANMPVLMALAAQQHAEALRRTVAKVSRYTDWRLRFWRGVWASFRGLFALLSVLAAIGMLDGVVGVFHEGGFLKMLFPWLKSVETSQPKAMALSLSWVLFFLLVGSSLKDGLERRLLARLKNTLGLLLHAHGRYLVSMEAAVSEAEANYPMPNRKMTVAELLSQGLDPAVHPVTRRHALSLASERVTRGDLQAGDARLDATLRQSDHPALQLWGAVVGALSTGRADLAATLIERLDGDASAYEVSAIVRGLHAVGSREALDTLLELAASTGEEHLDAHGVFEALGRWPTREATVPLVRLLASRAEAGTRVDNILNVLGPLDDDESVGTLEQVARDATLPTRRAAVLAKMSDNTPRAAERAYPLILEGPHAVAFVFEEMSAEGGIRLARRIIEDQDASPTIRTNALQWLGGQLGPDAEAPALALARELMPSNYDWFTHHELVSALGEVDTPAVLDVLVKAFITSAPGSLNMREPLIALSRSRGGLQRIAGLTDVPSSDHRALLRVVKFGLGMTSDDASTVADIVIQAASETRGSETELVWALHDVASPRVRGHQTTRTDPRRSLAALRAIARRSPNSVWGSEASTLVEDLVAIIREDRAMAETTRQFEGVLSTYSAAVPGTANASVDVGDTT